MMSMKLGEHLAIAADKYGKTVDKNTKMFDIFSAMVIRRRIVQDEQSRHKQGRKQGRKQVL